MGSDPAVMVAVSASIHPRLVGLVDRLVGYRIVGAPPGVHVGMPSRSLTLIITLDAPLAVAMPGGPTTEYAQLVSGLCRSPAQVHHNGFQFGLQLDVTPSGARHLLHTPAAPLADTTIGLDAVIGRAAGQLADQAASATTWQERFEIVQRHLLSRVDSSPCRTPADRLRPEIAWAWRRLVGSQGRAAVAGIAKEVGWSTRHLTSRFAREFGLTPKLAGRVIRFDRSRRLIHPGVRLADVAARCGYADQSHLNRDWLQFAGTSPIRWMRDDGLAFVQDESQAVRAQCRHDQ